MSTGSNNLFFDAGTAPAQFTTNMNVDPLVANLPVLHFHLTATSPAKDAGVATGITHDFDGNPRPAGAAFDIGAFEIVSTAPRPNPPGVVHVLVH